MERAPAATNFHPFFLDDTKLYKRPEDLEQILYDFACGVGRGRGALRAVQSTVRFSSVMLTTGEVPVTSFTRGGGTRARVLPLWGSPFGGASRASLAAVQQISTVILDHHGHLGPRLVAWLLRTREVDRRVFASYARHLATWTGRARGNGVASRMAAVLAALSVARELAHEELGLPAPAVDPLESAWRATTEASTDADRAADALRDVMSWATSQQHRFFSRVEGEPATDAAPPGGWLGAWSRLLSWKYLAVLPTELRAVLDRHRFDTDAVLRVWHERGWLLGDGTHRTRKVTVGERKERCYAISREACMLVQGEDETP